MFKCIREAYAICVFESTSASVFKANSVQTEQNSRLDKIPIYAVNVSVPMYLFKPKLTNFSLSLLYPFQS